jgi:hypothetical protein
VPRLRGLYRRIGIFNQSCYEEVVIVRLHPELLAKQRILPGVVTKNIWRAPPFSRASRRARKELEVFPAVTARSGAAS